MSNTNTVKFGLKGCYYAKGTLATNGSMTYGTPVALPGAVSLSLEAQGENTPFYADDIIYYMGNSSSGYSGDLELAKIPDSFKKDILGYAEDANGILYEPASPAVEHFALIFQFSGDKHNTKHVMYNCTASRPAVASSTKTESTEPQTESVTITASSVFVSALNKDVVKASVTPTESTAYNAWETSVYSIVTTA